MRTIPLTEDIEKFKQHLASNRRVIFSAKFGDGKTHFLQEFEESLKSEARIITIHPLNYSVASNEDIFEYIKRDIIIQLKEDGIYESLDLDAFAGSLFSMENTVDLIGFLISILPIPTLGMPSDKIKKFIKRGLQFKKDYDDQKLDSDKYLSTFTSQKGGIYNHDAYTQLIENVISRLRKDGKQMILVIEDLDRIDPAHIFRILNVLGTHINDESSETDDNKFGFDNIVMVLDYEITRHIFHHFYGKDANYEGYIKKYLSSYPYRYSILTVARDYLYDFLDRKCGMDRTACSKFVLKYGIYPNAENVYLSDIIRNLSVRDIAKAMDGIDTQFDDETIEIRNGIKIKTGQRIIIFLSLLKRLGYEMSHLNLVKSFINIDSPRNFNVLGAFMLVSSEIAGNNCFYYQNENIGIRMSGTKENCTCEFYSGGTGYSIDLKAEKILDMALLEAENYVHDWI